MSPSSLQRNKKKEGDFVALQRDNKKKKRRLRCAVM
jgi:hypothetical protein